MNSDPRAPRRLPADGAAAFGLLVREHQSALRGFLRRLTRGDHALADDLAQETFLEAYRKLAQFRGGSFAGWLYAIAWSRFLMQARRRNCEPLDTDDVAIAGEPEQASMVKLDLEKAFALLSAGERAALTLCFALGMAHDEAARILKMPPGTVKSHIARGRQKLKILLKEHAP